MSALYSAPAMQYLSWVPSFCWISVRDARPERNQTPDQIQEVTKGLYWMAVRGTTGVGQSRADVGVVQRSRQSRGRGAGVGRRRADVDGGGDPRWRRADGDWSGRGYLDNRQRQDGCRRRTKTDTKTMTNCNYWELRLKFFDKGLVRQS